MASIFISHSSADKAQLQFLKSALEKAGHRVRFSSDFVAGYESGTDWAEQIEIEVKAFDLTVFWLTKKWLTSPHCVGEFWIARQHVSSRRMYVIQERGCDFPPTRREVHRWTHDDKKKVLQEIEERLAEIEPPVNPSDPYPGLRSIAESESHLFFGRKQIVQGMETRIWLRNKEDEQRRPFKVILGPSGVGKTSLLRAGLYANCRPPSRLAATESAVAAAFDLTIPLDQDLRAAFCVLAGRSPSAAVTLDELASVTIERFRSAGGVGIGARAILFVDAFERFYDPSCESLRKLVARVVRDARVNVITSMRTDTFSLISDTDPDIGPLTTPINIQPIDEDTLPDLIVQPAERVGWRVDEAVVAEFVRFFSNNRNGLPLVAFALRQLWLEAQRDDRATREKRIHIGLLQAVATGDQNPIHALVSDHCASVDGHLDEAMEIALRRLLFRICRWEPSAAVVRPGSTTVRNTDPVERGLVSVLASQEFRLFTVGEGPAPLARPAHDRILDIWPRARRIVSTLRPQLVLRSEIEQGIQTALRSRNPPANWFNGRSMDQLDQVNLLIAEWEPHLDQSIVSAWNAYRDALSDAARLELANEAQIRTQIDLPRASLSGMLAQASADDSDWLTAAQFAMSTRHLSTRGRRFKAIVSPIIRASFELREVALFDSRLPGYHANLYGGTVEGAPPTLSAFRARERLVWYSDGPPDRLALLPDNHKAIRTLVGGGWGCVVSARDEYGREASKFRPKAIFLHHSSMARPIGYNLGRRHFSAGGLFAGQEALTLAFAGSDEEGPSDRMLWVCRIPIRELRDGSDAREFLQLQVLDQVDFDVRALAMSGAGPRLFVGGAKYHPDSRRKAAHGEIWHLHFHGVDKGYEVTRRADVEKLGDLHSSITSASMSRDGDRMIIGGAGGRLYFHELRPASESSEPRLLRGREEDVGLGVRRTHAGPVTSVAFSGNGTRAFSGSATGEIRVWDAETGAQLAILKGHSRRVDTLEVTGDGQFLASFSVDGTARLWDARTLAPHGRSARLNDWPVFVDFLSPDEIAAVDSSGTIWAHKVRNTEKAAPLMTIGQRVNAVTRIVNDAGFANQLALGVDGSIILCDLGSNTRRTVSLPPSVDGRAPRVTALCNVDGRQVLGALLRTQNFQSETELVLLDSTSGELRRLGLLPAIVGVLYRLSNGKIVCGRNDGIVSLADLSTGIIQDHRFSKNPKAKIRCIAEVPQLGVTLLAGSFGSVFPIQVWDTEPWSSRPPREWIQGHKDQINAMTVLKDGRTLVSAGRDCMVRFWHIEGRIPVGAIRAFPDWVSTLAGSPDGTVIATGGSGDKLLRTWGALPYHYSRVEWDREGQTHYSDAAFDYMAELLPRLRPEGIPSDVLRRVGLDDNAERTGAPISQKGSETPEDPEDSDEPEGAEQEFSDSENGTR